MFLRWQIGVDSRPDEAESGQFSQASQYILRYLIGRDRTLLGQKGADPGGIADPVDLIENKGGGVVQRENILKIPEVLPDRDQHVFVPDDSVDDPFSFAINLWTATHRASREFWRRLPGPGLHS
jgi:hypothetical protein